jgi:hypothetical protein
VAVAESWTGDDVADVLQQLISTLGACPRISIVGSLNPGLVCRLRA